MAKVGDVIKTLKKHKMLYTVEHKPISAVSSRDLFLVVAHEECTWLRVVALSTNRICLVLDSCGEWRDAFSS